MLTILNLTLTHRFALAGKFLLVAWICLAVGLAQPTSGYAAEKKNSVKTQNPVQSEISQKPCLPGIVARHKILLIVPYLIGYILYFIIAIPVLIVAGVLWLLSLLSIIIVVLIDLLRMIAEGKGGFRLTNFFYGLAGDAWSLASKFWNLGVWLDEIAWGNCDSI